MRKHSPSMSCTHRSTEQRSRSFIWAKYGNADMICYIFRIAFCHAMHFSTIACRLSVRLSVCPSVTLVDCDHIGWNSSKIISPLVSMGCSLFATPTRRVCSKGNTPKIWTQSDPPPVDLSVGDILSQIAAEWL